MAAKFLGSMGLGLAYLQVIAAAPPEVIPGPGLPSLASLGLTTAQLYEMPLNLSLLESYSPGKRGVLSKRFEPVCGPTSLVYTHVDGIIACYNYLRSLGTTSCTVRGLPPTELCRSGDADVSGFTLSGRATSSSCEDVSLAALWVIDHCTRPDQTSAGFQAANGNGDLIVMSTRHDL